MHLKTSRIEQRIAQKRAVFTVLQLLDKLPAEILGVKRPPEQCLRSVISECYFVKPEAVIVRIRVGRFPCHGNPSY